MTAIFLFWVAEDGSTYWANSSHGSGAAMNQSALYAMRYDSDGLALGAFDARLGAPPLGVGRYRRGDILIESEPLEGKEIASHRKRRGTLGIRPSTRGATTLGLRHDVYESQGHRHGQPDIGYHYYRRWRTTIPFRMPREKFPSPSASPRFSRMGCRSRIIGGGQPSLPMKLAI